MDAPTCKLLEGLLVLLAGVVFLLFGTAYVDVKTAHLLVGLFLSVLGVLELAHVKGPCPLCTQ